MPRVIDKDELKKAIQENICQVMCDEPRGCSYCRVDDVWDVIYEQPTVDAVEVVRCKDCQYYYEQPRGFSPICELTRSRTEKEGFCSWGKKER